MNREILEKPFPQNLIKSRKGLGGKQFTYVEGAEYIQRLNDAFDGNWSFEIIEHQIQADEVIVLGKLTANGVIKSAFGGSSVTVAKDTGEQVSIADDLKAAATDALKKACSLLGIGLHLYSDEKSVPQTKPTPVRPANGNRLSQKQLSAIWSMARSLRISSEDVRKRTMETFNTVPEQLEKSDASVFISALAEQLDRSRGAA